MTACRTSSRLFHSERTICGAGLRSARTPSDQAALRCTRSSPERSASSRLSTDCAPPRAPRPQAQAARTCSGRSLSSITSLRAGRTFWLPIRPSPVQAMTCTGVLGSPRARNRAAALRRPGILPRAHAAASRSGPSRLFNSLTSPSVARSSAIRPTATVAITRALKLVVVRELR